MLAYYVSKAKKGVWVITQVQPGWINPLPNSYPSRDAAATAANELAGPDGSVTIVKPKKKELH
jgi:hypothetical protein